MALAVNRLLAIDPGPELSAWVIYDLDERRPIKWLKEPNEAVLVLIDQPGLFQDCAIEMVASYGMAVGQTVFETCVWTGRFIERWMTPARRLPIGSDDWFALNPHTGRRYEPMRVFRKEAKLHLCGTHRAKDANVRQALIDRYGPGKERAIGLKASPGPLYGLKADCWAALAVAITAAETHNLPTIETPNVGNLSAEPSGLRGVLSETAPDESGAVTP